MPDWTAEKEAQLYALLKEKKEFSDTYRAPLVKLCANTILHTGRDDDYVLADALITHAHEFRAALKPFDSEEES